MTAQELVRELTALNVNYMIANIEMHKLLYSDPYQYKDELKRTKSFNSPRQAIVNNSPKMNVAYNNIWNEGYEPDDIGYTKFTQDYFRTTTHKDIIGVIDLPNYKPFEETDGSGIISQKAYREFRIRTSEWNSNEEKQYRYDVAFEKRDLNIELSSSETQLLKEGDPKVKSAYTPLKPIVSGSKLDKNGNPSSFNNIVLDKYALYPLSYKILKQLNSDSNAMNLYKKMQSEDIDYIVFDSGRKVGAETSHSTYNEDDGTFNNTEYSNVVNIPFSIMSLQSEVPSKEVAQVTRGSQVSKLITMDYMDNGVPADFFPGKDINVRYKAWKKLTEDQRNERSSLHKEITNNKELLKELTNQGYQRLIKQLGLVERDGKIVIEDLSEATKTLRNEIFKREVNSNISDALSGFLEGNSVLEATPAYQQIKNILYSIVDKEIVSTKISGGMKVQIPSSLFESTRTKLTEINGKSGYTSTILNFYSKGDLDKKTGKIADTNVMEIMVGRWFDSNMSDDELLKYLNDTTEGQKILSGLAFRIPTQAQNSIDAFRIKQFLPKEFGDSVVVPAAIVRKVGSDFDIDKLSIYLKNIFVQSGKLKLVPFFGYGNQAKDKFAAMFDKGELFNKKQKQELEERLLTYTKGELKGNLIEEFERLLGDMGVFNREDVLEDFILELSEAGVKSTIVNRLYKQSIENEFIQSSENLVTNPLNFERLISPNSAEQLKSLGNFIAEKTTGGTFDYTDVSNMLDRRFMSRLRHAFVTGKYAIGIAAVNQTNHSLNQRSTVFMDYNKLDNVSPEDKIWLGDAKVNFKKYNQIEIGDQKFPTLSGVNNADGQLISNILGQFIDGYVDISKGPWIMELGATPNVASTFMFLAKIGVPIEDVAYFMNQPIIRDYLKLIENSGYSWLFIDNLVEEIRNNSKYSITSEDQVNEIPETTILRDNVGKETFTTKEKQEQQFMLTEFLKYSKMANQLFLVTQGSNYDTSNFNDSFLIFKKGVQFTKAQDTIISSVNDAGEIIPAVNNILEDSHIGNLANRLNDSKDAISNFLVSDRGTVNDILKKVLLPYVNVNNKLFVKIARKAVNDLFDYVVQTDQNFNLQLRESLLSDDGVASDVVSFIDKVKKDKKHVLHNNHVINLLEVRSSFKAGENVPTNVTLKNTDNKVYDQNNIIYAFRELREELEGQSNLYDRLVTLSILQSGLSNSPISFTSLIPYEDFERIYNKSLSKIENISNLNEFYTTGVFERNNWNDSEVVPNERLFSMFNENAGSFIYPSIFYLPTNVKGAISNNEIPQVVTSAESNDRQNGKYKVITWEKNISKANKAEMRKVGDYSYINKGLFKRVENINGSKFVHTPPAKKQIGDEKPIVKNYNVYKMINAWGDSFRAQEFYTTARESIIDNGFIKVDNEVSDSTIGELFSNKYKTVKQIKETLNEEEVWKEEDNNDTCAPF
jgi:hypothetical protein